MKTIGLLGEGAWGTAVATLLAERGHRVLLWCYDHEVADQIKIKRVNEKFFPGVRLASTIIPVTDFKEIGEKTDLIFEAIPVRYFRDVLLSARAQITRSHRWVLLSKGIETDSLLFPSQVLDEVLGFSPQKALVSGPSFACELATKQPTCVVVASDHEALIQEVQSLITTSWFFVQGTDDVMGVQVIAALKNVVALGIGIADGAGFGDNTRAFLFTKALQQATKLVTVLGGRESTVYGLAGVGDMVMTSYGASSKNRACGKEIGKGASLESLFPSGVGAPEGITSCRVVHNLAQIKDLDLAFFQRVYEIVHERKDPRSIIL